MKQKMCAGRWQCVAPESIKENFRKGSPEMSDTKQFSARHGYRFGNTFRQKNIKLLEGERNKIIWYYYIIIIILYCYICSILLLVIVNFSCV